ncbi:MAG TPA: tRNA-dihydrouridine synthase family protein [Paludibacter sp.]|nr:tRNA-dihydrouridine synthase family protein [Paludibacter sp.]
MEIYLAPLQGLTDWIFRESYCKNIGGFDKTFSPFIRVQNNGFYRPAQCNDILPEHNQHQKPVPQFLGNDALSFALFEELCLEHGYTEVNINMGCPYPMVTNRGLGSGMLPEPAHMEQFLKEIFRKTQLAVSIKCRLGLDTANEFEALAPIFNAFPLNEIIIHPRIGKQQYKGKPDREAFFRLASGLKPAVCYNGDICAKADIMEIQTGMPRVSRFMIGRGIVENPFLALELKGIALPANEKAGKLKSFHSDMIELGRQKYSGDLNFLKRFEEFWLHHAGFYRDGHKVFKQVKKSKNLAQYERVVFEAINTLQFP